MMSYKTSFVAAALLGSTYAQQLIDAFAQQLIAQESDASPSLEWYTNEYGALIEEETFNGNVKSTIRFPSKDIAEDFEQQADHIDRLRELISLRKETNDEPIYTCSTRENPEVPTGPLDWLPVFVGEVTAANPTTTYTSGRCFKDIEVSFSQTVADSFNVTVSVSGHKGLTCSERLLIANTEVFHYESFHTGGTHEMTFQIPDVAEQEDVGFGGIKVFMVCDSLTEEIASVTNTLKMMINNQADTSMHIPDYMVQANMDFLSEAMDYDLEARETNWVDIDENLVQSGDFFGAMRLDGLGPMIMYGTGGRLTHSTMAMWFDDGLYIVESQGGAFWPNQGIQRTPFQTWLQWCYERDQAIIWLPLKKEVAAKFNESAAYDFWTKTEGLPYGYHTFLYGWMDTPRDNLPGLLADELMPIVFSLYEIKSPENA